MARIVLSQSQVTTVLTTGLIFVLTILIFLYGYVVQQKTVTGIQTAIKPRMPRAPPSIVAEHQPAEPTLQPSRIFGSKREGHVAFTDFEKAKRETDVNVNWNRLAHVQLVRNHHDMCNAIMILSELHRLRSPARRVLLFPQAWAAEKKAEKGEVSDPFLDISRRLMKIAARRYGVELRPVSPMFKNGGAEGDDVYSLASAYALTDFDRVLSIETPGLLVDASPLDAVLAFTEPAPFAMLHDTKHGDGVHAEDLFLLQPSTETHHSLRSELAKAEAFNDTLLSTAFGDPLLLHSSSAESALIRSIGVLHDAPSEIGTDQTFNATAFLSDVSYIRFSDPKLPGPEYEVPWSDKVAARPKNRDADWTWTKLYGEFAMKRMDVCGLDLETWRP